MLRRIAVGVVACLIGLACVVALKTWAYGPPSLASVPAPQAIAIDKTAIAKRLAEALRFRTISRGTKSPAEGEAFLGLHKHLAENFPKVHKKLKRETVGRYSLLYTWIGSDPGLKAILIAAHMDVVPVEPGTMDRWTHPPYAGTIADGFIWGRGALDMKASVLGVLEAVERLLGKGFVPKRTIYLAFGHDEELGGNNGAAKIASLLKQRGVRLQFTLDEGSIIAEQILPGVTRPVALIGLAEKGLVTLELTARAKGGHSSMPPRATAIGKLARAIHRLRVNPMPAALKSPAAEMFEFLAPELPMFSRIVLANRWLLEPLLVDQLARAPATNATIRTTIAPTIVEGGIKPNVLPTSARAAVNFRILPGDTIELVIAHVRKTINDRDVVVRQLKGGVDPSPVADVHSASFATLRLTTLQIFPDVVVAPSLVIVRTDSRHYEPLADNSYRFLPLRLGPNDLERIHGTNERVSLENYAEIVRFYVQLLTNTAGP